MRTLYIILLIATALISCLFLTGYISSQQQEKKYLTLNFNGHSSHAPNPNANSDQVESFMISKKQTKQKHQNTTKSSNSTSSQKSAKKQNNSTKSEHHSENKTTSSHHKTNLNDLFSIKKSHHQFYNQPYNKSVLTYNSTWAILTATDGKDKVSKKTQVVILDYHDKSQIKQYRHSDHLVVCRYSAGTAETWQSDVKENIEEWKKVMLEYHDNETNIFWLDISLIGKMKELMSKRIEKAKENGCDAVLPDFADCYLNSDCFSHIVHLNADGMIDAQKKYNNWTVQFAHEKGLKVCSKNAPQVTESLADQYDCSVIEVNKRLNVTEYQSMIDQQKPVFGMYYGNLGYSQCKKYKEQHVMMKYCRSKNGYSCDEGSEFKDCWNEKKPVKKQEPVKKNKDGKKKHKKSLKHHGV